MKRSIVVVAALVVLSSPAVAQPGISAPLAPPSSVESTPPPKDAPRTTGPGGYRPAVAFFLSVGATTGTVAYAKHDNDSHPKLLLAAFVLAPSTGRW